MPRKVRASTGAHPIRNDFGPEADGVDAYTWSFTDTESYPGAVVGARPGV
jgi:hypothetical protein